MISQKAITDTRLLIRDLYTDLDNCKALEKQELKQSNNINAAYWKGKQIAYQRIIGILCDIAEKWEDENTDELEDEAAERSEKDCMWEDRA